MVKRSKREYFDHHHKNIKSNQEPSSKKSKNKGTFKYMFLYGFIIFLIGFVIIIYINQYVNISRKNFKIEKLEERKEELQGQQAHLELSISRLKSLDRIEKIAKEELGMKEPEEINYIVLKSNRKKEELKIVTDNQQQDKKDKQTSESSLVGRIFVWFKELNEVEAGTLDE